MGAEEPKGGGDGVGVLGEVIPAAELDALPVKGMGFKGSELSGVHGPSLEGEALPGRVTQFVTVGGIYGAEVALGRNVEAHGFHRLVTEASGEPVSAHLLVAVINSLVGGIIGKVMQEMADIVEKGGGHEGLTSIGFKGEGCGLQGMFQLADGLEAILRVTVLLEQLQDLFNFACRIGIHVHLWYRVQNTGPGVIVEPSAGAKSQRSRGSPGSYSRGPGQ